MNPPLEGDSNLSNTAGVTGTNNAASGGAGVLGKSITGEGVHGQTNSAIAAGVAGFNSGPAGQGNPSGVFGKSANGEGVHGETDSGVFAAVAGINSGPAGQGNPSGVFGKSANGEGVHGETASTATAAVAGLNTNQDATGAGVFAISVGRGPAGFFTTNGLPSAFLPPGLGDAVFAMSGPSGNAIHATGGTNAGLFEGTVTINGGSLSVNKIGFIGGEISADSIFANNKHFRVDHPLDPANRYLIHATVESSERLNLYSGIAVLDDDGQAEVVLPEWFDALNGDLRYQLTCIGGFAPVYIAAKASGNRFRIGGGYAGLEVSWQIAGRRQDRWAREHPFMVVEDKPVREGLHSNGAHFPEGLSFRS